MKRLLYSAMMTGLLFAADQAAGPVAFEAATLKRAMPEGPFNPPVRRGTPTRVEYRNYPLGRLIAEAYGLADYQIQAPAWVSRERYDVAAVKRKGTGDAQVRLMLQSLLAERLHLLTHKTTKELAVYHLLPGKNVGLLRPEHDAPDVPGCQSFGTLTEFAELLARRLNSPVLDKTGISGTFFFILAWTTGGSAREAVPGSAPPLPPVSAPPPCPGWTAATMPPPADSIFDAVKLQMGLKLEQKGRLRVDVLAVDRIDKMPEGN